MFPGANAQVYRNEAGEPIGWDYPSSDDDLWTPDEDDFDLPAHAFNDLEDMDDDELLTLHESAQGAELAAIHDYFDDRGIADPCQEKP